MKNAGKLNCIIALLALFFITSPSYSANYDGEWSGATSKGRAVEFTVHLNKVITLTISAYIDGDICKYEEIVDNQGFDVAITADEYTITTYSPLNGWEIKGAFTSLNTCEGIFKVVNDCGTDTVTWAAKKPLPDADDDGSPDSEETYPNDPARADPKIVGSENRIVIDVSQTAGASLKDVITMPVLPYDYDVGSPIALPDVPDDYNFPYGLIYYKVTGIDVGDTITVNLTFPDVPDDARIFKFDDKGFHEFFIVTITGDTITLFLTDGGAGDGDGVENGVIRDPCGIAVPVIVPEETKPDGSPAQTGFGSGSGGPCFLSTIKK